MKNTLLLAMLITLPYISIAQTQLKVNADSRGRSCNGGLGICHISTNLEMQKNATSNKTTALKLNDITFELVFDKNLLSEQEQKSLCNKTLDKIIVTDVIHFTQEDDLIIDTQTLQLLEINPKYNTLKKGKYPLHFSDNNIKITLTLSEQ